MTRDVYRVSKNKIITVLGFKLIIKNRFLFLSLKNCFLKHIFEYLVFINFKVSFKLGTDIMDV